MDAVVYSLALTFGIIAAILFAVALLVWVYIPDGETKTLAEIGNEDSARKASFYGSAIDDFAEWLKEQK